jgi:hypothetical protein
MRTVFLMVVAAFFMTQVPATAKTPPRPEQLRFAEREFYKAIHNTTNAAEARKSFSEAADAYAELISCGYAGSDLFRNCGNAYLLADDLPNAILAYRLGLKRQPLDGVLWDNLEFARDQVAYPGGNSRQRPPGDDWPPFLPRAAPDTVLHGALALNALAWVAVTAWLMTRHRKVAIGAVGLFAAVLVTGSWWCCLQTRIANERQGLAVVARNGVTLRRGNGSLYPRHPDLPQVNRGMEARLLTKRADWVQVQFPGGEIGWLPREAVVVDFPCMPHH